MDKILVALNHSLADSPMPDFATCLAQLTTSTVVGLTVGENSEKLPMEAAMSSRYQSQPATRSYTDGVRVAHLTRQVQTANPGNPIVTPPALLHESRYADILITDPALRLSDTDRDYPSQFVRSLLQELECPVLLTANATIPTNEILFFSDGSGSTAMAIKWFSYLFPELADLKARVLCSDSGGRAASDKKLLGEWMQNRYSAIGFEMIPRSQYGDIIKRSLCGPGSIVIVGKSMKDAVLSFMEELHNQDGVHAMINPVFFLP